MTPERWPEPRWRPALGAWPEAGGVRFRVWAPGHTRVELVLEGGPEVRLLEEGGGDFGGFMAGLQAGARYSYRLDGEGPFPDPASRFQPLGVHGPSEVIDPRAFTWADLAWRGRTLEEVVLYELHVGTFTPAGTFAGAAEKLPYLRDLGVTAVELMPVADFPGAWNWGYDGVAPFAPARCYGRPDDLRRLVDAAHRLGLAVLLDVVYNHFGPDGAHQGAFSPYYFSERHLTPWGRAVNLDGPHCRPVRTYFIENACHWIHEYHVDGLRLDATHALVDESPRHFLAELACTVRESAPGRAVLLVAEDHRNLARLVRPEAEGGWGLDAVWADDLHHQLRRGLAGDSDGYFRDFTGRVRDLAATLQSGWFFKGQHSDHLGGPRGTDPAGLRPGSFVVCLQNHDQVGNRALGERLSHQLDLATYRAASVVLLCAPETPLLFMGQEWAAGTPFLFFTHHHPELGGLVTQGRRHEFRSFTAFSDPTARELIPDPQSPETFHGSRLDWLEAEREPHAGTQRLYRELMALRRREPLLGAAGWEGFTARPAGESALVLTRESAEGGAVTALIQLRGPGTVTLSSEEAGPGGRWSLVLDTEDAAFCPDPQGAGLDLESTPRARFARPGAVILRRS